MFLSLPLRRAGTAGRSALDEDKTAGGFSDIGGNAAKNRLAVLTDGGFLPIQMVQWEISSGRLFGKSEVRRDTMNRKTSLIIGVSLLVIAICFIGYAANHPEAAFPWSNKVTFMLYGMYSWLIFKFLLDIPILQKISKMPSEGSY